jgi:membrane fusion protein (multidrug efflux system)
MMAKSVADGLVRAPFAGIVSEKMISPGEWVAPGKALFTLVKDDPLKIDLSVPESAVSKVAVGQHVELTAIAFPGKHYGATIKRLGAEIGHSRALIAEAELEPGSDLVPGMFAEAHVVIGQTPHVVAPATAVAKRGKDWRAFVIEKGVVEEHIVQLGEPPAAGQVAILDGVAKGAKLVAKVTDAITDGVKVVE